MQPIQDKEFDKLFQEKLSSFEFEPSASLWDKISNELDPQPVVSKKKVLPVYWMAAASVVVIMGVGFWLMNPSSDANQSKYQAKVQKVNPAEQDRPEVFEPKSQDVTTEQTQPELVAVVTDNKERSMAKSSVAVNRQHEVKESSVENAGNDALQLTMASVKSGDTELSQSQKTTKVSTLAMTEQPAVIASNNTGEESLNSFDVQQEDKSFRTRTKIRSVGDLVNFVVAKVDHRDEKVIEFKDDEDEGSTVSSLNLGLLKFKAKK